MPLLVRDFATVVNRRGGGRTCADVERRNALGRVKEE